MYFLDTLFSKNPTFYNFFEESPFPSWALSMFYNILIFCDTII